MDGSTSGSAGSGSTGTRDAGPRDVEPGPDAAGAADGRASDANDDAQADAGATDAAQSDGATPEPCVAAGSCDPFDPSACPGQACRWSQTEAMCMDVQMPAPALGEACGTLDCEPSLICASSGGPYVCHALCRAGSVGECPSGSACSGGLSGACVRFCMPLPEPCDVLAQDCADPNDTCTFASHPETQERYTGCRPAGPQQAGEACGDGNGSCGHGLVCISQDGASTCHNVCDPQGGDPMCPAGLSCDGLSTTYMVPFCK